jgi:hypothetical protein
MITPGGRAYCEPVARVDPEDDAIWRFIVCHYRYDPQRRERRYVVVAAFDNEAEYFACVKSIGDEIGWRRERGEPVDPHEHASGVVHEPGYLRRSANGHLVTRAIKHGSHWIVDRTAGVALQHVRHASRAPFGLARRGL